MSLKYILFFLLMVTLISCSNDDDCCEVGVEDTLLNYDGENQTAPQLPPGNYNFAMRLPGTTLNRLSGQVLKTVSIYMYDVPNSAIISIFSDQITVPGQILYTQSVTDQLNPDSWNTINLTTPFPISGSGIWVGVDVSLDALSQTVGCDAGPGNVNGDWLYDGSDQEFRRFVDRVGESINWNIRVVVGE
jgi:hypothetical protein